MSQLGEHWANWLELVGVSGQTQGSAQEGIADEDAPAGRVILDWPRREDGRTTVVMVGVWADTGISLGQSLMKMPRSVESSWIGWMRGWTYGDRYERLGIRMESTPVGW